MVDINNIDTQIENVDQLPVIYGLLQKMKIQTTIDQVIQPHGNWQGLSIGWVITIWQRYSRLKKPLLIEKIKR